VASKASAVLRSECGRHVWSSATRSTTNVRDCPSRNTKRAGTPPSSRSRIVPNTLGASNAGQQYQSIVPSATVCRSPTRPCSAIGG